MSRVLNFLFLWAITPLFPSFFFFLGIKIGYIDSYEIVEYYNVIFVDQMVWPLYGLVGLLFAILFMTPFKRFAGAMFLLMCIASLSMLHEEFSQNVAEKMFVKNPFYIKKKPFTYKGKLLYEGRHHYYLFSDENNRTITFKKDEVDEAY